MFILKLIFAFFFTALSRLLADWDKYSLLDQYNSNYTWCGTGDLSCLLAGADKKIFMR